MTCLSRSVSCPRIGIGLWGQSPGHRPSCISRIVQYYRVMSSVKNAGRWRSHGCGDTIASQATHFDRHALQMRWTFESLSNARPQLRQRTWRMPPGHRLTEWANARHSRCAISPCSRMRPEQTGHIELGEAIVPPWRSASGLFDGAGSGIGIDARNVATSRPSIGLCATGQLHASPFCIIIVVQ